VRHSKDVQMYQISDNGLVLCQLVVYELARDTFPMSEEGVGLSCAGDLERKNIVNIESCPQSLGFGIIVEFACLFILNTCFGSGPGS
jgi:hypothetical protein